jgi:hypothetical protein
MKGGYVLYISDHSVNLLLIQGKRVVLEQNLLQDESSFQHFAQYLRVHTLKNVSILVNSRHEEYRQERIPKLYRGDRQALLKHKRKRLFPGIDYTCATPQGMDKRGGEGREQEKVLFSCLAAPDLIQPWIRLLLDARVPVRGIMSLPLVSQKLINYLPQEDQVLLVTYTPSISANSAYGLHQSYFAKQQLMVSRLIPLESLQAQYYASHALPEIFKTQQYLNGQSLTREDRRLHVVILLPRHEIEAFEQHLALQKISEFSRYYLIDVEQLFQLSGVDGEASRRDDGLLYFSALIAWYTHQQGKNHYAQASETRYAFYKRIREGLWLLIALIALSSVAYGSKIMSEALSIRQDTQNIQQQTQVLQKKHDAAQQYTLVDIPVDVIHIKNTVDVAEYAQSLYRDPYQALRLVSQHLNDFPSLRLDKIHWQAIERTIQKPDFAAKLRNTARLRQPKQEQETLEILRLDGHISGAEGNAIRAFRTLKNFIRKVEDMPQIREVKMLNSPMNLATQNLSGAAGETQSLPKAVFQLEFTLKFEDAR